MFRDRVAVVTGGASGIGYALGKALVAKGAQVVLADIDTARLDAAAAELGARAVTVDVADPSQVEALIDGVFADHGRLDYLFNNAGICLFGEVRDMTLEQWRALIEVNIAGVVHGVHFAYPRMIEQGSGHIVNTASIVGLVPGPAAAAYTLTKHAVLGLSTSLRGEGAAFGVKVSALCPGLIDTPIVDNLTWLNLDKQAVIDHPRTRLASADYCADVALRGVAKNKAIITVTANARLAWWMWRAMPGVFASSVGRSFMKTGRRLFSTRPSD